MPHERRGAVITVRGGPGSGKTALAVRLLGHLMRNHPEAKPRLITPSGTLRAHLLEAASGHSAARELFLPATSLRSATHQAKAIVIDEAQRTVRTGGRMAPELAAVLLQVRLAVVFLDERQIIRPDEGTSVAEISSLAQAMRPPSSPSAADRLVPLPRLESFTEWVDALLYDTPVPWTGQDGYDPRPVRRPLPAPAVDRTSHRHAATPPAPPCGFCWPWTRTRPRRATSLPLDITIDVPTGEPATGTSRTWHAAWNAADPLTTPDGTPLAPRSQLWASHTGGHQQVGCIYTAQGLEYHHAGVIIGPDLTWTDNRWTAHPEHSHDPKLRHLTPNRYLPYALNTYRVLLTRGTDTTRIHATHPATQRMLSMPCPLP